MLLKTNALMTEIRIQRKTHYTKIIKLQDQLNDTVHAGRQNMGFLKIKWFFERLHTTKDVSKVKLKTLCITIIHHPSHHHKAYTTLSSIIATSRLSLSTLSLLI